MIEADKFHETYRANLVPYLKEIRELAHAKGIYGTYLSGAGPTIMTITTKEKSSIVKEIIEKSFSKGKIISLDVDVMGIN